MDTVARVVRKITENDRYIRMAGVRTEEVKPGYARVAMTVEDKHLNSLDNTHGGAVFTLADAAFALAANSHGQVAVGLNMSISFVKATRLGDVLTATATEDKLTRSTGLYRIEVTDQSDELVAVAEGLVFRKKDIMG